MHSRTHVHLLMKQTELLAVSVVGGQSPNPPRLTTDYFSFGINDWRLANEEATTGSDRRRLGETLYLKWSPSHNPVQTSPFAELVIRHTSPLRAITVMAKYGKLIKYLLNRLSLSSGIQALNTFALQEQSKHPDQSDIM